MKRIRFIIIIIMTVYQPVHADTLTLKKAIELMKFKNPDITMANQQICKKYYEIDEVRAVWFPSVDVVGSYSGFSENSTTTIPNFSPQAPPNSTQTVVIPNSKSKAEIGLDVSYPITAAFVNMNTLKYKQAAKKAIEAQTAAFVNQQTIKLATMYFQWVFSYKQVVLQQTLIDQLQQNCTQIQEKYSLGVSTSSSVLEAQAKIEAAQVEVVMAQNTVDSLKYEIMNFIQYQDSSLIPQEYTFGLDSAKLASLDTVRLDTMRSELQANNCAEEQLLLYDKILIAQRYPMLFAVAGYRYGQPGLHMGSNEFMGYGQAGVQVKFNIFDGFKVNAQQAQNQQQIATVQTQRTQQTRMWNTALQNAKRQLHRMSLLLHASSSSYLVSEAFALDAKNNLAAGTITAIDYTNACTVKARAQYAVSQALFMQNIATLQVYYAAGKDISF